MDNDNLDYGGGNGEDNIYNNSNNFNDNKMKIPYQIRIEPEQLEQLKKLAKENGTSVNHEIRQSIRNKTPMYNSLEGFKRFLNNDLGYDGSLNEEIEVYREFLAKK